jgi:hypothetical protein
MMAILNMTRGITQSGSLKSNTAMTIDQTGICQESRPGGAALSESKFDE